MRCEACDRSLPEGAQFCAHCGTPVAGRGRAELVARRLEQEIAQGRLFEPAEIAPPKQEALL